MDRTLITLTAAAYAAGAVAHLLALAFPRKGGLKVSGNAALGAGFLANGAAFGAACKQYAGGEFLTLAGGLLFLAWLACGAFLFVPRVRQLPGLGAFIGPLLIALVLPGLVGAGTPSRPEALLGTWLLPAHVTVSFLGLAVFTVASAVSAMYLLMERELSGKRFGALFTRLPALADLDLLGARLVRIGFFVFGLSLLTGALFARQAWGTYWDWDPKQVVSLLAWLLYGGLLLARRNGWYGRRAAVSCMLGLLVLLGSFVGLSMLGWGRHGGNFQ